MIDQTKLAHLVDRTIGSKGQKLKKQNEYMYWSPFVSHHKPKLQINIITGKWHCWVSNMGGHNLFQLFKKVNATREQFSELGTIVGDKPYRKRTDDSEKKNVQVELPEHFLSLAYRHPSPVYKNAMMYLQNRGIGITDIIRYGIGYCEEGVYANRIIVPSYSSDGELNYFVGRDIYEGGFKYKNPPVSKDVIGFDLFINWDEPIILCEGVFDAIAIRRNAIPLFGKTIPKSLMKKIYEKQTKQIYILLDSDAISDSIKITDNLMKNGINVYYVNLSEEDPSDMGFKKVINLIKETKQTSFSDLMRMRLNGKTKKYMEI